MVCDSGTHRQPLIAAHPGVHLLKDAWEAARDLRLGVWEFALEVDALCSAGLSHNDLRILLAKGLADRRREVTRPGDTLRRFRAVRSLTLAPRDCIVLTSMGYQCVVQAARREATQAVGLNSNGRGNGQVDPLIAMSLPEDGSFDPLGSRPRWDAKHRELLLGAEVVKRFPHAAPSQELILSAFEEEHWPAEVDDPLPLKGSADAKRRLRQTVKNLNRAQRPQRLLFIINPDGQSIRWQVVATVARGVIGR